MNGSNFGYFKGKRGLRQGDPVSPLIFTICMDYLSRLIAYATARWPFHYHPQCKGIRLTHLMFADDLLMFCKGDAPSILLLVKAFTSFSNASGLQMNNAKSEIFFNGVSMDLQTDILSVTGFHEGKMPFRYLGVPIQPGKVSKKDCSSLVEKIVTRIRSIGAKKLSYAGRVVLINSVLNTLYNYWAAMFVIPKAAIKRVEAICRNFLWDSSTEFHRVPLVGWDRVTMAKDAGGLGIKKASTWNIAAVGKLVNWIYVKADRLWIKWIDSVYLKGTSWHDFKPTNDSTWTWKTICKVKDLIKQGFTDNQWAPHQKGYTISQGYEWLMGSVPKQQWTKLVWNEWNVPKHSFNSWLIMQGGLNTKAKLFSHGCCEDDLCILCAEKPETSEHLFDECKFSCQVQKHVEEWIDRPFPTDSELLSVPSSSMKWKALTLVLSCYKYTVWHQRNQARTQFSIVRPILIAERMKMVVQQQIRKFSDRRGAQHLNERNGINLC
ncbi:uncharacterized protein LOC141649385 [Silene latifolia]|uniref:uncharacterized protein LOC141649385 n=1 Tax=Silene latifolia TaxID=37657 RepID=UPI003D77337D